MPDVDCGRWGATVDMQARHATVETELVESDGEAVDPSSHFLCLDCYDDLRGFFGEPSDESEAI
ncbi:hypothetical protein G9464_01015 [Halostella sp. JP-L12]|uniref:hypothetical protein n=1 Tax=Halostella TaxID=1843185 RepID=UPI000EF7AB8A|nr:MULTISPECIES: hypothetical protein [Halostella]NHN46179.1 hypothetical protein [Halostella sp. JP-L12]